MSANVTSVVFAGIGGQGVVRASDIAAEATFRAGYDVKKSDVRGMSQRGGSVTSDVRFGEEVLSPMVPLGEADFLVVLDPGQVESNRHQLRQGGVLIDPSCLTGHKLPHAKSLNVALLGALSTHLDIAEKHWLSAIRDSLPEKVHAVNEAAFGLGRAIG